MPRETSKVANDYQVGGEHYRKSPGIQHWDYAELKNFDKFQYVITKYVERWRDKNGIMDLEKALHYLEKYIEVEKNKLNTPKCSLGGALPLAFAAPDVQVQTTGALRTTHAKNPFGYDPILEA